MDGMTYEADRRGPDSRPCRITEYVPLYGESLTLIRQHPYIDFALQFEVSWVYFILSETSKHARA
jgi:hypothetical protein